MIIYSKEHLDTFGQENTTRVFLKDLFLKEIDKVSLNNSTITEKDIMNDKMGIMDVKAVLNDNIQCDIEVQVVSQDDIEKRIVFYMSKEYTKTISQGKKYGVLNKTIAVLIADFELKNIEGLPKYATTWNFREEDYPEYVLTDALEIYIIELPKLTKYAKNTNKKRLNLWAEFIKNPEVKIMENKEDDENTIETKKSIKKAQERYEELKRDKHEMELAELREKYILDQNSLIETGYNHGKEDGLAEGLAEGLATGTSNGRRLDAKKMLEKGMDIKTISEITELSEEEIEKLK